MPRTERRKTSSGLIMGLIGGMLLLLVVSFVVVYPMLPCDLRIMGDLWLDSCDGSDVAFSDENCEYIITQALAVSDNGCQFVGSNQICYGHDDVDVDVGGIFGYFDQFDAVGDVIPITIVRSLYTSPLDEENGLWGVAVLKVRANMVRTSPRQNVTFLIFGDTDVENTSGDMSAFSFTTGITDTTCKNASVDGILLETPDGSGITFQANGVDILIEDESRALLEAQPGEEMTISMYEGSARVHAEGVVREASAGYQVSVPLNEEGKAVGPPSEPKPLPSPPPPPPPPPPHPPPPPDSPHPPPPRYTPDPCIPTCLQYGVGCPATPTPSPTPPGFCSDITVSAGWSGGVFNITNHYRSDIVITEITLSWPVDTNGRWKLTHLDGKKIQSGNFDTSPATDVLVTDASRRTVQVGTTRTIAFEFQNPPAATGYQVTFKFDVGCSRSGSQ